MNTINQTNVSFHSTIIPKNAKKPLHQYLDAIKNCNLKFMSYDSVDNCYKKILNNAKENGVYNTGFIFEKEDNALIRFMGHSIGNDEYVYSQLKKVDKNVRYVKDFPTSEMDNTPFEILV